MDNGDFRKDFLMAAVGRGRAVQKPAAYDGSCPPILLRWGVVAAVGRSPDLEGGDNHGNNPEGAVGSHHTDHRKGLEVEAAARIR